MREVFEPTVRMIPAEYRSQIEPAQFFHEVLTHRWFTGRAGRARRADGRGRGKLHCQRAAEVQAGRLGDGRH